MESLNPLVCSSGANSSRFNYSGPFGIIRSVFSRVFSQVFRNGHSYSLDSWNF